MSVKVAVTRDQVEAAKTEVAALRSAGIEPESLLVRLANARSNVNQVATRQGNEGVAETGRNGRGTS